MRVLKYHLLQWDRCLFRLSIWFDRIWERCLEDLFPHHPIHHSTSIPIILLTHLFQWGNPIPWDAVFPNKDLTWHLPCILLSIQLRNTKTIVEALIQNPYGIKSHLCHGRQPYQRIQWVKTYSNPFHRKE